MRIAAVDLGSNSFRLQLANVFGDQIYPRESFKEMVRLAEGVTTKGSNLNEHAQRRALACLRRFHGYLRGLPPESVRVVGTNTLRIAHNAPEFIKKAEKILGYPIEILPGREEARLIYIGVAHGLPPLTKNRLIVDIGGGSTELIVGSKFKPLKGESLNMGCVSYSEMFFPKGKIKRTFMQEAEIAARTELQSVLRIFRSIKWKESIGSSGTARALAAMLELNRFSQSGITSAGLLKLRKKFIAAGHYRRLKLLGLQEERAPVIAGGLAIMLALFKELKIRHLAISDHGLREGVLYDMIGRFHHEDMRDATAKHFMQRYHVDSSQAARVEKLAIKLFKQFSSETAKNEESKLHLLSWAAKLHEIGLSISYSAFHKHAAYIIENADMPGFSKKDQTNLATLILSQRGSLTKILSRIESEQDWLLFFALRIAVLVYRGRTDLKLPLWRLRYTQKHFNLKIKDRWLKQNPLFDHLVQEEITKWQAIGFRLTVRS